MIVIGGFFMPAVKVVRYLGVRNCRTGKPGNCLNNVSSEF